MITQMNTVLSSEIWQDIRCIGKYKTAEKYIWKFNK